jgi:hypothetical protein
MGARNKCHANHNGPSAKCKQGSYWLDYFEKKTGAIVRFALFDAEKCDMEGVGWLK